MGQRPDKIQCQVPYVNVGFAYLNIICFMESAKLDPMSITQTGDMFHCQEKCLQCQHTRRTIYKILDDHKMRFMQTIKSVSIL